MCIIRKVQKMEWNKLLTADRLGARGEGHEVNPDRSDFQRDFDRIVFSSAFRRLHGKTQVFPLPENDIIHTRLTHSLEAASVGRSLGTKVGNRLPRELGVELGTIVSVACLAHDIGNPPLGHSGEKAIAEYFQTEGQKAIKGLTQLQQQDFLSFEGNAMGFHLLTYSSPNVTQLTGGFALTYPTLAAFVKYPRPSKINNQNKNRASEKKPGIFQCDMESFKEVADTLGIPLKEEGGRWVRYPLAFLTEAADDICYSIMDLEDGFKYEIISYEKVSELLIRIIQDEGGEIDKAEKIIDEPSRISYFRAKAINSLVDQVSEVFLSKEKDILEGNFDEPLCNLITSKTVMDEITHLSKEKIYSFKPVLEIEAAGFKVLPGLLDVFINALTEKERASSKKTLSLIPHEYYFDPEEDLYTAIMGVTTYVAGMTDTYAIDTYRNLEGIQLPHY